MCCSPCGLPELQCNTYDWALFREVSSRPASLEAAKVVDFLGAIPDMGTQQADAMQAHTQAPFIGTPTWVALPQKAWPKAWNGVHNRVCPLQKALHGQPESGGKTVRPLLTEIRRSGSRRVEELLRLARDANVPCRLCR